MSTGWKSRLPQFSLAGLFWFASAVAIGFAVSQTTAEEEPNSRFAIVEQVFYSPTLLAIAAVLIVYELVRQAFHILQEAHTRDLRDFECRFAWLSRLTLAVGIAGLLLLTQLINREIFVPTESDDMLQFYGELWPACLLTLSVLLAMRMMVLRRSESPGSGLLRWLSFAMVAAGILIIGLYIITDRLLVSWLVHVATDNVEKSHNIRWHRPDVYPHHVGEGFRSFWTAFAAVIVVLTAGMSLLGTTISRGRVVSVILSLILASCVVAAFRYAWWFATQELPRISPDLASEPWSARSSDYVAGAVLLSGTAAVIGFQLTRMRSRQTDLPGKSTLCLPRVSGLMVIAAGLVVFGFGSDSLILVKEAIMSPSLWFNSASGWEATLASLVSYFIMPETLIVFAAAITGVCVVWQYYRPPVDPTPLMPMSGLQFAVYWVASAAWLAAAVPVFAAFGFCYWLGPWIL